jgi:hypothetical protein
MTLLVITSEEAPEERRLNYPRRIIASIVSLRTSPPVLLLSVQFLACV